MIYSVHTGVDHLMNLRTRFERFCYRNRDKGIPNLMLFIVIGSAIVYFLSLPMFSSNMNLTSLLCFDKNKILEGQVWRLFTYVFTEATSDSFLTLIFLYFFYMLGRHVELSMGTLRFNLFYLSGVLLMDVFAMIFCPIIPESISLSEFAYLSEVIPIYFNMAFYLHLSLILTFATTHPDSQFLIFFILPIKAWVMGIIYLALIAMEIFSHPVSIFPHNLFPLVGLLNYLLFAGKDVLNLFPFLKNRRRYKAPKPQKQRSTGPIPFRQNNASGQKQAAPYTHRCTVCGRTDVTNPELEFRYCSRCNGYFCYCEDHINNHTHIE